MDDEEEEEERADFPIDELGDSDGAVVGGKAVDLPVTLDRTVVFVDSSAESLLVTAGTTPPVVAVAVASQSSTYVVSTAPFIDPTEAASLPVSFRLLTSSEMPPRPSGSTEIVTVSVDITTEEETTAKISPVPAAVIA